MEISKKTWYIKLIAVIFTGAFVMLMCLLSQYIKKPSEVTEAEASPTPDVPVQTPMAKVVLDPGHGGFDHGASGVKTGVGEDTINLAVSKAVEDLLVKSNISVTLTRNDNEAIASKKKEDMKERRRIMHETGADLTVSIHMNKFKDTSIHGPMVFYTQGDERSAQLAECILRNLCMTIGIPIRMINTGDYYVIRNSKIPAVIVECGFLSNPTEEQKLCDPDYQMQLASGIASGIIEFVKNNT